MEIFHPSAPGKTKPIKVPDAPGAGQFQTIKPNFRRSSVVLQDYPSGEMVRAFDSRVGSVRHRVGTKHGLKARATTAKMAVLWQAGGGGSGGDPVVWVVSVKGGVGSYY